MIKFLSDPADHQTTIIEKYVDLAAAGRSAMHNIVPAFNQWRDLKTRQKVFLGEVSFIISICGIVLSRNE